MKAPILKIVLEDLVAKALREWGGEWADLPMDIALGAIADLIMWVEDNMTIGMGMTLSELGYELELMSKPGVWK